MKNLSQLPKKSLFCLVLWSLFILPITAQNTYKQDQSDFWEHVRFGGGLGLSFGDGFFSGTVAPSAIYQFNNQFSAGIGLNATFSKRKDVFNSTVLGGSVLALFNPINEIQLSSEFEQLNVNRNFDDHFVTNADENYWYPALFLGAGYRTGNVIVGIRYDVLYDEDDSIYADPWMPFFRFYF